MEPKKPVITVEVSVNAPLEKAWRYFTEPAHIVAWNHASDDWHCPHAENDPRTGGKFSSRMGARDGSAGFDFAGTYDEVIPMQKIAYTMGDRKVVVTFEAKDGTTHVREEFEAESENPLEMQRAGWQSILDNFKKHTEAN